MSGLQTQAQVFNLAKGAGFANPDAEIAAAIAMAEAPAIVLGVQYSSFSLVGDQSLANSTWGFSYGGWQIRSVNAQYGTGQYRDALMLARYTTAEDLGFHARSALRIWTAAGNKFTPWTTFTSGSYQGYLQKPVYNPPPVVPPGTYMVTGGDTLSGIGAKTHYDWRLIAALNQIVSPYTIFPGEVLLLPDWTYTIKSGDSLSLIASKYAKVSWARIAAYNELYSPYTIYPGKTLKIPRYTSWDGKYVVL